MHKIMNVKRGFSLRGISLISLVTGATALQDRKYLRRGGNEGIQAEGTQQMAASYDGTLSRIDENEHPKGANYDGPLSRVDESLLQTSEGKTALEAETRESHHDIDLQHPDNSWPVRAIDFEHPRAHYGLRHSHTIYHPETSAAFDDKGNRQLHPIARAVSSKLGQDQEQSSSRGSMPGSMPADTTANSLNSLSFVGKKQTLGKETTQSTVASFDSRPTGSLADDVESKSGNFRDVIQQRAVKDDHATTELKVPGDVHAFVVNDADSANLYDPEKFDLIMAGHQSRMNMDLDGDGLPADLQYGKQTLANLYNHPEIDAGSLPLVENVEDDEKAMSQVSKSAILPPAVVLHASDQGADEDSADSKATKVSNRRDDPDIALANQQNPTALGQLNHGPGSVITSKTLRDGPKNSPFQELPKEVPDYVKQQIARAGGISPYTSESGATHEGAGAASVVETVEKQPFASIVKPQDQFEQQPVTSIVKGQDQNTAPQQMENTDKSTAEKRASAIPSADVVQRALPSVTPSLSMKSTVQQGQQAGAGSILQLPKSHQGVQTTASEGSEAFTIPATHMDVASASDPAVGLARFETSLSFLQEGEKPDSDLNNESMRAQQFEAPRSPPKTAPADQNGVAARFSASPDTPMVKGKVIVSVDAKTASSKSNSTSIVNLGRNGESATKKKTAAEIEATESLRANLSDEPRHSVPRTKPADQDGVAHRFSISPDAPIVHTKTVVVNSRTNSTAPATSNVNLGIATGTVKTKIDDAIESARAKFEAPHHPPQTAPADKNGVAARFSETPITPPVSHASTHAIHSELPATSNVQNLSPISNMNLGDKAAPVIGAAGASLKFQDQAKLVAKQVQTIAQQAAQPQASQQKAIEGNRSAREKQQQREEKSAQDRAAAQATHEAHKDAFAKALTQKLDLADIAAGNFGKKTLRALGLGDPECVAGKDKKGNKCTPKASQKSVGDDAPKGVAALAKEKFEKEGYPPIVPEQDPPQSTAGLGLWNLGSESWSHKTGAPLETSAVDKLEVAAKPWGDQHYKPYKKHSVDIKPGVHMTVSADAPIPIPKDAPLSLTYEALEDVIKDHPNALEGLPNIGESIGRTSPVVLPQTVDVLRDDAPLWYRDLYKNGQYKQAGIAARDRFTKETKQSQEDKKISNKVSGATTASQNNVLQGNIQNVETINNVGALQSLGGAVESAVGAVQSVDGIPSKQSGNSVQSGTYSVQGQALKADTMNNKAMPKTAAEKEFFASKGTATSFLQDDTESAASKSHAKYHNIDVAAAGEANPATAESNSDFIDQKTLKFYGTGLRKKADGSMALPVPSGHPIPSDKFQSLTTKWASQTDAPLSTNSHDGVAVSAKQYGDMAFGPYKKHPDNIAPGSTMTVTANKALDIPKGSIHALDQSEIQGVLQTYPGAFNNVPNIAEAVAVDSPIVIGTDSDIVKDGKTLYSDGEAHVYQPKQKSDKSYGFDRRAYGRDAYGPDVGYVLNRPKVVWSGGKFSWGGHGGTTAATLTPALGSPEYTEWLKNGGNTKETATRRINRYQTTPIVNTKSTGSAATNGTAIPGVLPTGTWTTSGPPEMTIRGPDENGNFHDAKTGEKIEPRVVSNSNTVWTDVDTGVKITGPNKEGKFADQVGNTFSALPNGGTPASGGGSAAGGGAAAGQAASVGSGVGAGAAAGQAAGTGSGVDAGAALGGTASTGSGAGVGAPARRATGAGSGAGAPTDAGENGGASAGAGSNATNTTTEGASGAVATGTWTSPGPPSQTIRGPDENGNFVDAKTGEKIDSNMDNPNTVWTNAATGFKITGPKLNGTYIAENGQIVTKRDTGDAEPKTTPKPGGAGKQEDPDAVLTWTNPKSGVKIMGPDESGGFYMKGTYPKEYISKDTMPKSIWVNDVTGQTSTGPQGENGRGFVDAVTGEDILYQPKQGDGEGGVDANTGFNNSDIDRRFVNTTIGFGNTSQFIRTRYRTVTHSGLYIIPAKNTTSISGPDSKGKIINNLTGKEEGAYAPQQKKGDPHSKLAPLLKSGVDSSKRTNPSPGQTPFGPNETNKTSDLVNVTANVTAVSPVSPSDRVPSDRVVDVRSETPKKEDAKDKSLQIIIAFVVLCILVAGAAGFYFWLEDGGWETLEEMKEDFWQACKKKWSDLKGFFYNSGKTLDQHEIQDARADTEVEDQKWEEVEVNDSRY